MTETSREIWHEDGTVTYETIRVETWTDWIEWNGGTAPDLSEACGRFVITKLRSGIDRKMGIDYHFPNGWKNIWWDDAWQHSDKKIKPLGRRACPPMPWNDIIAYRYRVK